VQPGIFISYRREDAAGDAGRLADHLQRRFRHVRVFLDVDTISPGADFAQVLASYLQQTTAVLVVIGPRWASLRDDDGARRLDGAKDFVRFEVEAALARQILIVPVLVQGATMPRAEDLPPSLAPLALRQAVTLDHAEFHADMERLCQSLTPAVGSAGFKAWRGARWFFGVALAAVLAGLLVRKAIAPASGPANLSTAAGAATDDGGPDPVPAARRPIPARTADTVAVPSLAEGIAAPSGARPVNKPDPAVDTLLAEATRQRRRNELAAALETLARARGLAPASSTVRDAQQDVAMQWIRGARVANNQSSFAQAIRPALAVVDAAVASATGVRRADLLAHEGWATFLLWRDGDRTLNPTKEYREALAIDPGNPYANAMLAHWILGRDEDLSAAVKLFDVAAGARRDLDAVRTLQWSAYKNAGTPEANAERVKLADSMRRGGEQLAISQGNDLWSEYYFAVSRMHDKERQLLLAALPPDDHISTLTWALEQHPAQYESRRNMIRYYLALLHIRAGRVDRGRDELRALDAELAKSPGSLMDAVRAELKRL
jgi:hypothetical protein